MKRALEPGEGGEEEASADSADPLHRHPPARTLNWVAESVGRGAEVVSVRRLTEGHSHANHVVTVREASGNDQEVVLRRWARPSWELDDPDETPEREAAVLELLRPVPVPTPRLINVDSDNRMIFVTDGSQVEEIYAGRPRSTPLRGASTGPVRQSRWGLELG